MGLFSITIRQLFIAPISLYRWLVSPVIGPRCRFYPSCSVYAQQAIKVHGVGKGLWLSIRRIFRCHPLNEGGYDPIPEGREKEGELYNRIVK